MIFTRSWWVAAGIRALKTFAQAMVAGIAVGAAFSEIDWIRLMSVAGVAALASILTSLAGLPEVSEGE